MPIPDYQSLMLPVLKAGSHGEVRIREVVNQLADDLNLTEDEQNELLPSGRQTTFSNRVHWAKAYLVKAGLLEATRRGYFRITERGMHVLSENPKEITASYLTRFPEFQEFRRTSIGSDIAVNEAFDTPDDVMRRAHTEIDLALGQDLIERILLAPPAFFEKVIVRLLVEMGYGGSIENAGRELGRTGDGGVDGVIDQDVLGLDRVYVQAKRYRSNNVVGAGDIRDFFGSLDRFRAAKGVFVTTSTFSASAQATAKDLSKRIILIDGERLTSLMIRYNVGVRIEDTLYVKKIDEDFFPE